MKQTPAPSLVQVQPDLKIFITFISFSLKTMHELFWVDLDECEIDKGPLGVVIVCGLHNYKSP